MNMFLNLDVGEHPIAVKPRNTKIVLIEVIMPWDERFEIATKIKHFIIQLMHNIQYVDTIKIIKYLKEHF